jgi:mono/diheme cytochrome c family protein
MRKYSLPIAAALVVSILCSCGGSSEQKPADPTSYSGEGAQGGSSSYDPNRGEGKFNAENVALGASLDVAMADEGNSIQGVKCAACHKLTDERLVGPGWKGVTERRRPEWLMNFITNPDPMIDKDPEVQAQLELCLVRMPNQSLTDEEARKILEFMRQNDGVK